MGRIEEITFATNLSNKPGSQWSALSHSHASNVHSAQSPAHFSRTTNDHFFFVKYECLGSTFRLSHVCTKTGTYSTLRKGNNFDWNLYHITGWSRDLLVKLTVAIRPRALSPFVESECPLPCSWQPVTGPYPEPAESSHNHIHLCLYLPTDFPTLHTSPCVLQAKSTSYTLRFSVATQKHHTHNFMRSDLNNCIWSLKIWYVNNNIKACYILHSLWKWNPTVIYAALVPRFGM
jgi:hypothetical protein